MTFAYGNLLHVMAPSQVEVWRQVRWQPPSLEMLDINLLIFSVSRLPNDTVYTLTTSHLRALCFSYLCLLPASTLEAWSEAAEEGLTSGTTPPELPCPNLLYTAWVQFVLSFFYSLHLDTGDS